MATDFIENKEFKCPNGLAKFYGASTTGSINKICAKCTDGTDLGCLGSNLENNFSYDQLNNMNYVNIEWDKVNELVRFMDKGRALYNTYNGKTIAELQKTESCANGYYGFKADKYKYLQDGSIIISNFTPLCAPTLNNGFNSSALVDFVPDKINILASPNSTVNSTVNSDVNSTLSNTNDPVYVLKGNGDLKIPVFNYADNQVNLLAKMETINTYFLGDSLMIPIVSGNLEQNAYLTSFVNAKTNDSVLDKKNGILYHTLQLNDSINNLSKVDSNFIKSMDLKYDEKLEMNKLTKLSINLETDSYYNIITSFNIPIEEKGENKTIEVGINNKGKLVLISHFYHYVFIFLILILLYIAKHDIIGLLSMVPTPF